MAATPTPLGTPANFPDTPTVNQIFTDMGLQWKWDGTKWEAGAIVGFASIVNPVNGANNYAPLDSGALTGTYTLNGQPIATGGPFAATASPIFTGVPTAPTAAPGNSTAQLATTNFVTSAINALNLGTTYAPYTNPAGGVRNYAPIASPQFTGVPLVPTATAGTATLQAASTAFVTSAIGALSIVSSFNGRNGAVTLTGSDITNIGGVLDASPTGGPYGRYQQGWLNLATYFAPYVNPGAGQNNYAALASPVFSGTPSLPTGTVAVTQTAGNNSAAVATTAFVTAAVANSVTSWNGRIGAVNLTLGDVTGVGGAPISNPSFQGNVGVAGTLTVGGAAQFNSNINCNGGFTAVNINATNAVAGGAVYVDGTYGFAASAYLMAIDGSNNRYIQWAGGWVDYWIASNGTRQWTNSSGSWIFILDGSGNLNISGSLGVPGNGTISGTIYTNGINNGGATTLNGNVQCNNALTISGPTYPNGGINTNGAGITAGPIYCNVMVAAGATTIGANVDTNGAVYVGGGANGYYLFRDGGNSRWINWFPNWYQFWENGTGYIRHFNPNQQIAFLNPNGRWGAYGYDVISDQRGKHAIARDERGLDVIRQLQPKTFTRDWAPLAIEGKPVPSPKQELGFIAQDILPVLKEAVTEWLDPDKTTIKYAVDPMAILAALVNAVQELDKKVH